jgi:DEAD/DEAH box helicase domain-containing protein
MTDLASSPSATAGALIRDVLAELEDDPRLVHVRHLPARPSRTGQLSRPLPDPVATRLPHPQLWSHQARAIDLARDGVSLTIATGTASGKSLCYQVPIAEAALAGATALLIYPTKALAQDQLLSFASWELPGMTPATYDGDCTPEERAWVRQHADVLLTNPEMLHHGILPNHQRWAQFLHSLRFVVIDELHTLRGVFGTHLSQVLRRLRRLVRHYGGAEPTFVFCSATIGEPHLLASELCGLPVTPVHGDGAPTGPRSVALWHPGATEDPAPDPAADRGRWSVHAEAGLLASRLISAGLRTLVFCRSRRGTELVAEDIRRSVAPDLADRVRAYRAGYLPSERREIEADLFGGRLQGVVATNALELGVDIGGLDAVVLAGFPGTIASFWQQIGRGGRGADPSLAVLVAGEDQLDQWMMRHPDELFSRPPERAVVNLDNPHVFVPHLGCAAHELGLRHADTDYWPDQLDEGIRQLVTQDRASIRTRRGEPVAVWTGRGLPAPTIGLRSAARGQYRICDHDDRTIGTVDESRAFAVTHPGAVYLHQGRAWRVAELDRERHVAIVEPASGEEYTQPRSDTTIRLLQCDQTRPVGAATLRLGSVEVTTQVVGYRVRSTSSHELLATESLELPPTHLSTRAVWYVFDDALVERARVSGQDLPGALHAAEHAAIGILPLFTICDRWDVGGVSTVWLPETNAPTVVIHDAHPGGAGIAELAFDAADRHLAATLSVISECACTDGCPSCVQSPKCGNNNEPLDKAAAARLLSTTLA